jgi:hypothetical protein
MATYVYSTNYELNQIGQIKTPKLTQDDLLFQIMPIRNVKASKVKWRQKDNYQGLQQLRGINGSPAYVSRVGTKEYEQKPGVYGEFTDIDELELTERASDNTPGAPVDVTDLQMECQDLLLSRRYDRMRQIGWLLLTAGTFSISLPNGGVGHTATYTTQTHSASDWSVPSTSTPLLDFRNAQLLSRGKGVSFGAGAMAIMNRATFNLMIANTNAADLYGKRTSGLANVLSLDEANKVLAGEDLPQIVIYDEGYEDEAGTFQLFIPVDKVVIVGKRASNEPVAEFQVTRNANNPNSEPGFYQKTVDDEDKVPRRIEIHDGGNYGPAMMFPSAVVVMSV